MSCMCGAEDCKECHPEHFIFEPCEHCGENVSFFDEDAIEYICGSCAKAGWRYCDECGCVWQETDDVQSCPDCSDRNAPADTPDSEVAERFAAFHRKRECVK